MVAERFVAMALRLTSLARRVTRRGARDLAARVAGSLLDRASAAAGRLVEFADAVRPALAPHLEHDAREIEVVPSPPRPARPTKGAPAKAKDGANGALEPRELAAWSVVRHLRDTVERHRHNVFGVQPFAGERHDVTLVHDMRVSSRRLRAFVDLFGPRLPPKLRTRLRKSLRQVTRALGELREWDVFAEELDQRRGRARDPVQRAGLEHVLEWVERRRARARRRAIQALRKIPLDRVEGDLELATDRILGPWFRSDLEAGVEVWTLLRPRIEAAFAAAPIPESLEDVEAVHDVRIQMKRLRYAYELASPAFARGHKPLQRPLKRVQRSVGTSRDLGQLLELLRARAERLSEHDRPVLGEGLAAVIRDVEAQWHRAQAAIEPALRGLDCERLQDRTRRALGIPEPHEATIAAE
jgi:CHAD domain-containing protein